MASPSAPPLSPQPSSTSSVGLTGRLFSLWLPRPLDSAFCWAGSQFELPPGADEEVVRRPDIWQMPQDKDAASLRCNLHPEGEALSSS